MYIISLEEEALQRRLNGTCRWDAPRQVKPERTRHCQSPASRERSLNRARRDSRVLSRERSLSIELHVTPNKQKEVGEKHLMGTSQCWEEAQPLHLVCRLGHGWSCAHLVGCLWAEVWQPRSREWSWCACSWVRVCVGL